MTNDCSVGRTITRPSPYQGLDWTTPCPVLPVEIIPLEPPLFLCLAHYDVLADDLYERLYPQIEAMGYVVG